MPDMDGLEVQAAMAQRGIAMPVIVLTGHGDVSTAVQAMKSGTIEFLSRSRRRRFWRRLSGHCAARAQ
jgi:two-component system response regulator FixJ